MYIQSIIVNEKSKMRNNRLKGDEDKKKKNHLTVIFFELTKKNIQKK